MHSKHSKQTWMNYIDHHAAKLLPRDSFSIFADPMLKALGLSYTRKVLSIDLPHHHSRLRQSRVFSLPGHYEKVIEKGDYAGLLKWTVLSRVSKPFAKLADGITMTSFAVTKNYKNERLISWPWMQNMLFPNPPKVAMPDLRLITRLSVSNRGKL